MTTMRLWSEEQRKFILSLFNKYEEKQPYSEIIKQQDSEIIKTFSETMFKDDGFFSAVKAMKNEGYMKEESMKEESMKEESMKEESMKEESMKEEEFEKATVKKTEFFIEKLREATIYTS